MREREREKGDAKVGGQVIEPFEFIIVSTKKGPFSNISIHDLMDILKASVPNVRNALQNQLMKCW